jgi:hypothetical protein
LEIGLMGSLLRRGISSADSWSLTGVGVRIYFY